MNLQIIKKFDSWFKILLSAILVNIAYFFPEHLGWIIFFAFIPLFFIKKMKGFFWGLLVFAPHFIWLYILFLEKSQAGFFVATAIYFFVVLYVSICSFICFFIAEKLIKKYGKKALFRALALFVLLIFITKYSLFFLGRVEGYPFFNPLILCAGYKSKNLEIDFFEKIGIKIFYLKPIKNADKLSPLILGQKIYRKLVDLKLEKYASKYKKLIIVAPESFYPFALNNHEEMVKFWGCVLPPQAYFLLGAQRFFEEKFYQTIYCINMCRIINFYDKNHVVAFTEKLPKFFKKSDWAKNLFLKDKYGITKNKSGNIQKCFDIGENFYIVAQICSELFYNYLEDFKGNKIIFAFVNDSWFCGYFKRLMENAVIFKYYCAHRPILYISHEKCLLI